MTRRVHRLSDEVYIPLRPQPYRLTTFDVVWNLVCLTVQVVVVGSLLVGILVLLFLWAGAVVEGVPS